MQNVVANDLGIYARVWDIKEVDLKQLIAEELNKVDIKQIGVNYKHQVEHLLSLTDPISILPHLNVSLIRRYKYTPIDKITMLDIKECEAWAYQ